MSETAALNDDFAYAVLSAVAEIPEGKVATYGQIARLIGYPKNARLVARVLSHAEYYGDYPCHRVVNATGRLAPGQRRPRSYRQKALRSVTQHMWPLMRISGTHRQANLVNLQSM